jgi:hypothetical protein
VDRCTPHKVYSDPLSSARIAGRPICPFLPRTPEPNGHPPGKDGPPAPWPVERASSEADFRVLEGLLVKLDPDRRWGGLSRTVTPEGSTLYVCRDHADAYRRAVRL